MADERAVNVTEADITSVAQKLDRFSRDLTPAERVALGWLLQRAAQADEVSGYQSAPIAPGSVEAAVLDALGFTIPR